MILPFQQQEVTKWIVIPNTKKQNWTKIIRKRSHVAQSCAGCLLADNEDHHNSLLYNCLVIKWHKGWAKSAYLYRKYQNTQLSWAELATFSSWYPSCRYLLTWLQAQVKTNSMHVGNRHVHELRYKDQPLLKQIWMKVVIRSRLQKLSFQVLSDRTRKKHMLK